MELTHLSQICPSGASKTMSRRVKRPSRSPVCRVTVTKAHLLSHPFASRSAQGDRAKGDRKPGFRLGGKPDARFSERRASKPAPLAPEPEQVAADPPPLPAKVQTVVVTADEGNMRVDRFLEARFPGLSFSHIQRIVRKGELRVNGKRADSKDRLEEGQSVRIPPLKLDAPKAAGHLSEAGEQDAAGAEGDDAVRGCRCHGAEQAGRARGAGRLRHHAPCRPDAGGDARCQGAEAAAGASARQGNRGLSSGRKNALCRDCVDRVVSPSLGAQDLLGVGCRRAEAEAGPHLDLSRQGRGRGRHDHADRGTMATRARAMP